MMNFVVKSSSPEETFGRYNSNRAKDRHLKLVNPLESKENKYHSEIMTKLFHSEHFEVCVWIKIVQHRRLLVLDPSLAGASMRLSIDVSQY